MPKSKKSGKSAKKVPKGASMTNSDRKKLWGLAGGQCSFPNCGLQLVESGRTHGVRGDEAHIKGEKPRAPRYDPTQTPKERESYENKVVLCTDHHREVDFIYPDEWPVERLIQIKTEHENRIRQNQQYSQFVERVSDLVQQFGGQFPASAVIIDHTGTKKTRVRVNASEEYGVRALRDLKPGQTLQFYARGLITFDGGQTFTTPDGIVCNERGLPLMQPGPTPDLPAYLTLFGPVAYRPGTEPNHQLEQAGALVGWIGAYRPGKEFVIGTKREYGVTEAGDLFMAVNDVRGTYADNDGEFLVDIRVVDS